MKTKLFLFVLLFPFVLSCNKDDKNSKDDILASEEVDIEFEVVSKGKVANVGGYIYLQEDVNKASYFDLNGKLIGTIILDNNHSNQNSTITQETLQKHLEDVSFELPIKIKKKAKRGVQAILFAWNPYEMETDGTNPLAELKF